MVSVAKIEASLRQTILPIFRMVHGLVRMALVPQSLAR